MTHKSIREWGKIAIGAGGFSRPEADALLAAARRHPCSNIYGTNILVDAGRQLVAQQMVGVIAAPGCSLEILPKVDPDLPDAQCIEADKPDAVRARLVRMLDVALGLDISTGEPARLAIQRHTLLDVLIRTFTAKLIAEVRRGVPRRYCVEEDDLTALRGRLDAVRQFRVNGARPDRLACRFDELSSDTPLTRIMNAAVHFLCRFARHPDTRRRLTELRHLLSDIPLVPISRLPWKEVRIDRTNLRWKSLFRLARLLMQRDWQETGHDARAPEGVTLLFPMNDLFEAYVAALLRKGLRGTGIDVVEQGGRAFCLGEWTGAHLDRGHIFHTRPDILLRRSGQTVGIIDTKWKKLGAPSDKKHGVSQADVYQMMAYARLYSNGNLMLLYPETPGRVCGKRREFGVVGGMERLLIGTIDVSVEEGAILERLSRLALDLATASNSQLRPDTVVDAA